LSGNVQDRNGDIAFLLYATPFIVNFVYAIYLWAGAGFSAILPQLVYLEVTQSPYIFLIGFAAVCGAAMIDFDASTPEARKSSAVALSKRLQYIAALSIILALIAALYSASGNPITAFSNVLDGRYPLVFPALLLLFSFAILPSVRLESINMKNALVIVLLIASPGALYEIGKRNTVAGLGIGLILLLAAAYLLVNNKKE
jgi:hypothetical protein